MSSSVIESISDSALAAMAARFQQMVCDVKILECRMDELAVVAIGLEPDTRRSDVGRDGYGV